MATTATIDLNDVLAALRRNPPFDDPYAYKKAQPFIADVIKIIGDDLLDDPVTIKNFFGVLADVAQLIKLDQGQSYFGHIGLTDAEFSQRMDLIIRGLRTVAASPAEFLRMAKVTETEALVSDGMRLIDMLMAEAVHGTLTFRKILLVQPGIFLPKPFS